MPLTDESAAATAGNDVERFVLFRLDKQRFAVELTAAERIILAVEVTPLADAPEVVLGTINVHGVTVPVYNPRRRLGLNDREIDITDQFLLARNRRRTVALVTDAVLGVIEPSEEDEEGDFGKRLEGGLQLPDGTAPIVDVASFLSPAEEERLEAALGAATAAKV